MLGFIVNFKKLIMRFDVMILLKLDLMGCPIMYYSIHMEKHNFYFTLRGGCVVKKLVSKDNIF